MSDKSISELREEFLQSASKLVDSASSVASLSTVKIEDKPVYTWDGQVVSATIYDAPDKRIFYAEVRLLDSTKIITGSSPTELRDIIFWLDKCLLRFLDDEVICILDSRFPAGIPF